MEISAITNELPYFIILEYTTIAIASPFSTSPDNALVRNQDWIYLLYLFDSA